MTTRLPRLPFGPGDDHEHELVRWELEPGIDSYSGCMYYVRHIRLLTRLSSSLQYVTPCRRRVALEGCRSTGQTTRTFDFQSSARPGCELVLSTWYSGPGEPPFPVQIADHLLKHCDQTAIGLSGLSAAHFHELRTGMQQDVRVNARHAVLEFSASCVPS